MKQQLLIPGHETDICEHSRAEFRKGVFKINSITINNNSAIGIIV